MTAVPLRLALTLSNLRGLPYAELAGTAEAQTLSQHADALCFVLGGGTLRPDERALAWPSTATGWPGDTQALVDAAIASGAVPLMMPARELSRPTSELGVDLGIGPLDRLAPQWSRACPAPGADYRFVAVDGGLLNNVPSALAATGADGIVLIVHPRGAAAAPGPSLTTGLGLVALIKAALAAVQSQAACSSAALHLAADTAGAKRRFLLTAHRPDRCRGTPGNALAGAPLGGFGGYLSPAYRAHDFELGRRNAQALLADTLVLPAADPLFAHWTAADAAHYAAADGQLPLIPLIGALHPRHGQLLPLPTWPKQAYDAARIRTAVSVRLGVLYRAAVPQRIRRWLLLPLWLPLKALARCRIVAAVEKALLEHGLR